jgi:hypothetical protein
MQIIYLVAIVVLGIINTIVPIGTMFTYGSNNHNNNDPRNQACHNSGFTDGQQNHAYNQTKFTQCGLNDRAYYEGFLSGCIAGPGHNYFSCQKLTNAPIGGGGRSNGWIVF